MRFLIANIDLIQIKTMLPSTASHKQYGQQYRNGDWFRGQHNGMSTRGIIVAQGRKPRATIPSGDIPLCSPLDQKPFVLLPGLRPGITQLQQETSTVCVAGTKGECQVTTPEFIGSLVYYLHQNSDSRRHINKACRML